ncbi:hypothetical protein G4B88_006226 [Cannabis sativa]|uniref:CCHC-type domain-containing protein n=1 Tax=Cannabis sativa TaxID=3483 RepID=A0A7J6IDR4_CANSA|nr:hypothetical protein G4B88_006226 [Cannabis sativa]
MEMVGKKVDSTWGKCFSVSKPKPVTWHKWIRVQVEIDINKLLFCGCFFKLLNGVNSWVQIKYENIGHFCYFCGCLGHHRSECNLGSPVMILDDQGGIFPLFGPWMNFGSSYANCFYGNRLRLRSRATAKGWRDKRVNRIRVGRPKEPTVPSTPMSVECDGVDVARGTLDRESGLAPPPRAGVSQRPRTGRFWLPKTMSTEKGGCSGFFHGAGIKEKRQLLGKVSVTDSLPDIEGNLNLRVSRDFCGGAVIEGVFEKSNLVVLEPPFVTLANDSSYGSIGPMGREIHGKDFCAQHTFNGKRVGFIYPGGNMSSAQNGLNHLETNLTSGPICDHSIGLRPIALGVSRRDVSLGANHELTFRDSSKGQNLMFLLKEKRALSNFFKAQENNIHDLEALGSPGRNKRKNFAIDIGVQPTSECNERTIPVKKRRLDLDTLSLGKKPFVPCRLFKSVPRDFPKGTGLCGRVPDTSLIHDSNESSEEPMDSEEAYGLEG